MSKKIPHPSHLSNEESVQNGFLYTPSDLFNDFSLSLEEERILAIIRSYGGTCYWSVERFAKYCRCSTRHILRAIQRLEVAGRLKKENRGNRSNLYSEVVLTCQPVMMTDSHDDTQSPLICQPVTSNMTASHTHSDSQSHYIDIYNNNYKERDNNSSVADAPPPLEPILEQPIKTPEPTRFVASELPSEDRAKLLALLKGPASVHGFDPEKRLQEILQRAEAWSCSGTDKKKFRVSWFETLKRQFVGREIKALATKQKTPASQTGLSKQQIETLWDLGWRYYHPEDWPADQETPGWVTDWHREVYRVACSEAFGMNYQSFFREEPAKNSNFHVTKFRRVLETIKLPETTK
jgi:hypothetical protein